MKITNQTLDQSYSALSELMQQKMPIKGAYGITRNLTKVKSALEDLQTTHQKLMVEYGTKNEDGSIARTPEGAVIFGDNQAVYVKAVAELMTAELDITPHLIKIADLGDVEISIGSLLTLDWLITE
jgi:hypothetical protein